MNIHKKNLIGLEMSVVNSKNPSLIGKKGIIVDETKNTLCIENQQKQKNTLIKDQVTIEICGTRSDDAQQKIVGTINGRDIVKQATDRIKVKK